jgi:hypothetical protein
MVMAICAALAACDRPKSAEPGYNDKLSAGDVALAAVAPDGTRLWAARIDGRDVYFSSRGTQVTESCGKNCTRDRQTPNAE